MIVDRSLKILTFAFLLSFLSGKGPSDEMHKIVYHQVLLLESKMDASPNLWQDMREGYLRGRTIRECDLILDSLALGVDPVSLINNNYTVLDSLAMEVYSGKEFDVVPEPSPPMFQVNYFSSSSRP